MAVGWKSQKKFPHRKFLSVYGETKGAGNILKQVSEFGDDYHLVQVDSEVKDILAQYAPSQSYDDYPFLFEKLDASGADVAEVWGLSRLPYLEDNAVLLYRAGRVVF